MKKFELPNQFNDYNQSVPEFLYQRLMEHFDKSLKMVIEGILGRPINQSDKERIVLGLVDGTSDYILIIDGETLGRFYQKIDYETSKFSVVFEPIK